MVTARSACSAIMLLSAMVVAALAARLFVGIDLSDESYYAAFVIEWLKTGIQDSPFLTIHQTAALLVYLPVRAYVKFFGSNDGVFLFLRSLYLAGSLVSAALWFNFLRRIVTMEMAALSAIFIISFIPFGLPAPSYNTTGMQGLTSAIACLGCAMLSPRPSSARSLWSLASAIAWGVAVAAYPTLGAVAAILLAAVLIGGRRIFPLDRSYAFLCGLIICVALFFVVYYISPGKIIASIRYLDLINNVKNFSDKLRTSLVLFKSNYVFLCMLVTATGLGLFRHWIRPDIHALLCATLVVGLFGIAPVLFQRSHDAILLVALTGIGVLWDLRFGAPLRARVVAICYLVSLLAGAVTTITATNTFFNFCIGGFPAAVLAATAYPPATRVWGQQISVLMIVGTVLSTSLLFLYGEPGGFGGFNRHRVSGGIFKGLYISDSDAALVETVEKEIAPMVGASTAAVFSISHPGILLATSAQLRMLTIFPLQPEAAKDGLKFTHDYYSAPAIRPAFTLVFEDGAQPINPMQPDFDAWYRPIRGFSTPLGRLSLFQAR